MASWTEMITIPLSVLTLASAECEVPERTKITLVPSQRPVRYDYSKSINQLTSKGSDTISPYDAHIEAHVNGLMEGGISVKSRINIAWSSDYRRGTSCFWYKAIELGVRIEPTVYIAREHRKGSCKHRVVMEHEMKHVRADRAVVSKYMGRYKSAVQSAVRKIGAIGPVSGKDIAKVRAKMGATIEKVIAQVTEKMNKERRARQQAIDSKEEYERVNNACR